jgi:hypothetical protein
MTLRYQPEGDGYEDGAEPGPHWSERDTATLGETVLYRLTGRDAQAINDRRGLSEASPEVLRGEYGQAHRGTTVRPGQEFPGCVVQRSPDGRLINLHVLLDGTDTHWAAACRHGRKPGEWTHIRR